MAVSPYIHFRGSCKDAIALYERAFGAKAHALRMKDAPPDEGYVLSEEMKDHIMHATMKINGSELHLSDGSQYAENPRAECNISVMASLAGQKEVDNAFKILGADGNITMPPQKTFWSNYFGMVTDKFGINWIIDCKNN